MALSFGNLVKPSTATIPFSLGLPVGDTRADKSIYDDGILRAARNTSSVGPVAKTATNVPLSFGTSVPKYSDPFASGQNLSYGSAAPSGGTMVSSLFGTASDFLSLASFGSDEGDTRNIPGVYDDGILRAGRQVSPIPAVHTATIDGGTGMMSVLKDAAKSALAGMGNSGDGDLVPVQYSNAEGGGINPLWIAGAAIGAGVLYFALAK